MISVIIPTVNEDIAAKVAEVEMAMPDTEIIVIDDKDRKGKGYSLKTGFKKATGDLILFVDADQQIAISEIYMFKALMKLYNADAVIGNKRHIYSNVRYPLKRWVISQGYRFIIKILFNFPIKDTQVGFKLFRKAAIDKIMPKILVKKFAFDIELLIAMKRANLRIIDAPVRMNKPLSSTSANMAGIFETFKDTLAVWYRDKILKWYEV